MYNILNDLSKPLSATTLLKELKNIGLNPNKTTIYRILKKLVEKKIAIEFSGKNGITFFEISNEHHHHFICNYCNTAYCLKNDDLNLKSNHLKSIEEKNNFKIESLNFNLYGICKPCSKIQIKGGLNEKINNI